MKVKNIMKNTKFYLSWTTLSNVHKHPCWYFNTKILGMKEPENEFMIAGKKAHQQFALKIKNKEKLPCDLDFQEAEVHFRRPYNDRYIWHAYLDGVNYRSKALLELKTVNKRLWTNSDMDNSMQPVYYSWISSFSKVFLLTCKFDLSEPKVYYREYKEEDWQRAEKWAVKGLRIIEETDWKTLQCLGNCPFNTNCFIYQRNI